MIVINSRHSSLPESITKCTAAHIKPKLTFCIQHPDTPFESIIIFLHYLSLSRKDQNLPCMSIQHHFYIEFNKMPSLILDDEHLNCLGNIKHRWHKMKSEARIHNGIAETTCRGEQQFCQLQEWYRMIECFSWKQLFQLHSLWNKDRLVKE